MEPGVFIVRSSTQADSLALSIKMPPEAEVDVENYLIEQADGGYRLENSPNVFPSLPLLIHHYAGETDELPVSLQLPQAIRECATTKEVNQIALSGQDFWTSAMAYRRSRPPSIYANGHDGAASLLMSRSVCGSLADFAEPPVVAEPRRRSTLRLGTSVAPAATNDCWIEADRRRPVMGVASGMLKKSQSAYGGIGKAEAADGKPNGGQRAGAHFFRQWLPSQRGEQPKPRAIVQQQQADYAQRQLYDQSDYFIPRQRSSTPSDESSNEQPPAGREQKAAIFAPVPPPQKPQVQPKKLTKHAFPSTSSLSSVGSTASAIRRGISARLRTFRSGAKHDAEDKTTPDRPLLLARSKDDHHAIERKVDPARFPPLQRGMTELNGRSLAGFQSKMSATFVPPSQKKEGGVHANGQPPLVPPHGRMTENSMQKCIDELKRKRRGNGENTALVGGSLRDKSKENRVVATADEQTSVVFRNQTALRADGHRRSVPNFTDDQSAERQSMQRMGRPQANGELQTINEGLVTPIHRRRQFARQVVQIPPEVRPERTEEAANQRASPVDDKPLRSSPPSALAQSLAAELAELAAQRTAAQPPPDPAAATGPCFVHRVQPVAKVKPQPVARTKPSLPLAKMNETPLDISPRRSEGALPADRRASLNESRRESIDEDTASVAGTVFNEPWESNVFENLLDLATYSTRPTKEKVRNLYIENCTPGTIAETEEERSLCSTSSSTASPLADVEVREVPLSPEEADDLVGEGASRLLGMEENAMWMELSRRIPSETNTLESNRGRSASLLNVSRPANSPLLVRGRAQTPGAAFHSSRSHDALDDEEGGGCSFLPAPSPARLRTVRRHEDPGFRIQQYVEQLAADCDTTFGRGLRVFVECTLDTKEKDPLVTIRNVRQFMTGVQNYLVKNNDDAGLLSVIEAETQRLASDEFLNVDAILESALHKMLLKPLRDHIYHLLVVKSMGEGSMESLNAGIQRVRAMSFEQLGFASHVRAPNDHTLAKVRHSIKDCRKHYSPFKKLEHFFRACSYVLGPLKRMPCTEDLVRWIVFILAKTSLVTCEVEAVYMLELLPQTILSSGHSFFYLACLFTAVHVLKNADSIGRLHRMSARPDVSSPQASLQSCIEEAADAFVRVAIPNETRGTIDFLALPAVKQMNVQRLCRLIASQSRITTPEDFGLCVLCDGYETSLHATETIVDIRAALNSGNKPHLFVYKRHEAKIAWPSICVHLTSSSPSSLNPTLGSTQARYI
ncbi:hypothetical protein M3Y99_01465500 [Aphelenchoides fujianensis]|nr:hypothetical protein M3Y99_01465500 [Aphelenchoides fujianensis]